jgi:predicted permease
MSTVIQDLRFGLRMLAKNPGFTSVAVITLALGIGANTVIFSVINGLFLHPAGIGDPGHLYAIRVKYDKLNLKSITISVPDFADILNSKQVFSSAAAVDEESFNYRAADRPVRLMGAKVSWQWFNTFGARPALGRVFRPEEDQPHNNRVIILAYSTWKQLFGGDPAIIGKTIRLNRQPYQVTGVMGPDFDWPQPAQIWEPLALAPGDFSVDNYFNERYFVVARARPGVNAAKAEAYVQLLTRRLIAEAAHRFGTTYPKDSGWGMFAVPFTEYAAGNLRTPMLILLGAVGFVLLIACSNIAGLILARSSARSKEFAVRAALGAQRIDLLRQALVESFLLTGGGAILGAAGAYAGLNILRKLAPGQISHGPLIRVDGHVLLFTTALSALAGIFLGVIPAGRLFNMQQYAILKEEGRSVTPGRGHLRLRQALVAGQVALALVLLVGAGLLLKSLTRMGKVDPGFDPRGVMTGSVRLPQNQYSSDEKKEAFYQAVTEKLESLPGVSSAAAGVALPFSGFTPTSSFEIEGRVRGPGNPGPHSGLDWITPGYFQALRIPLLKGRLFTEQDRMGTQPVVVIDENLVRQYWPHQDPIGQRLRRGSHSKWATIVGVVGHVDRTALVGDSGKGVCYYPMLQQPIQEAFLIVKTKTGPSQMGKSIQAAVAAVDPAQPVADLKTLEQYVAGSLGPQRIEVTLLSIFSGMALFLAAIGLYGVMSYSVAQRTQEIGIRMALGAQRWQISALVIRQGMRLALAGVLIGAFAASWMTGLLTSELYEVRAFDPVAFALTALVLLAVALLASYIPARRAAKVDPMVALRNE